MNRTAFVIAAFAMTLVGAPAFAETDPYKDRATIRVGIADLDLAKPADQEEMVQRVERAARRICASEFAYMSRRKCAAQTVEYTMNLVPQHIKRAYAAATDRRESFALAAR